VFWAEKKFARRGMTIWRTVKSLKPALGAAIELFDRIQDFA
jgi:hypothetical protein